MGQRFLVIHGTSIDGITQRLSIRKRSILFGVSLIQRIRDIPNDRFGEIAYLETLSMSTALEEIIPALESEAFFQIFKAALDAEFTVLPTPDDDTTDPVPRYFLSDSFRFITMNLDPIHLYPSDFLTRIGTEREEEDSNKIAGYRITAKFESPDFQEKYPPLQCKPTH